jgi:hypothetical protein
VSHEPNPVNPDRRTWLKTLEAGCERFLAQERGNRSDPGYAVVREDVEKLLARVRAELDAELGGRA